MTGHKKHTVADVRAEEMAELLKKWDWTLDEYVGSMEVWGLCPNKHRKQFQASKLRKLWKRGPGCDTCVAVEMAELLETWGWTLDEYVGSLEVWGLCPNKHRKKCRASDLRRTTRGPRCQECF